MSQNIQTQNINSYYSSNPKAERSSAIVAVPPSNLPSFNLCSEEDMKRKMKELDNDIYQGSKKEKNRNFNNFVKGFSISVVLIMLYRLIKRVF